MIQVAKIGRTIGVSGGLKLHLSTDFPHIFKSPIVFIAKSSVIRQKTLSLKIKNYHNQIAIFEGYESLEDAKSLINLILYVSKEDTRKYCQLNKDEAFYFDIVGCEIVENGEVLGRVEEVERIASIDYLLVRAINTDRSVKLPKNFMIPYIDRYVVKLELSSQQIITQNAKEIWYSS